MQEIIYSPLKNWLYVVFGILDTSTVDAAQYKHG